MQKALSILIFMAMFVSLLCVGTSVSGAAEGTPINSAQDFAAMDLDGDYYLNADIIITTTYEKEFKGTFDGNGHTITTAVPLFAEFNGLVRNLTIDGTEIKGAENLAAFAVHTTDGMIAENVVNKVDIIVTGLGADKTSGIAAGGILADAESYSSSYFRKCVNYGNITVETAEIESSAHYATFVGGIAGRGGGVEIKYCENHGNITGVGNRSHVGGIVGRAAYEAMFVNCDIVDCTNTGLINSGYDAGGIAGNIGVSGNNIGVPYTIIYCINTADITGGYRVGGFVGYCYASGATTNYYIEIRHSMSIGNVIAGRTDGISYSSLIIGYSNSINNKIIGCLAVGELLTREGEGMRELYRCIMGCSSAKTSEMELHDNYICDNNTTEWYTYASASENEPQRIKIEEAIGWGRVTRCTLEELSSGAILSKLNAAADTPVFKQTVGTDPYPTIDLALREQRLNAESPLEKETEEETTTSKPKETEPSNNDETTTAPGGDETTTAPKSEDTTTTTATGDEVGKKNCKSAVIGGVAIFAILGCAVVLGKKR
ncbi:MAG: hypothetical protein ACOYIA_01445 [Eubacteriales bacterium]|jgi:hypothetical protein